MIRPFRRSELWGVAAFALWGFACTPNNSVQPGAPVLTEMKIIENGGAAITVISPSATDCPSASDAGVNGGMCDPTATPICRLASASNWCRCVATTPATPPAPTPTCVDGSVVDASPTADAGAPDAGADAGTADAAPADAAAPLGGTWDCSPFQPTAQALFVFDRLLDGSKLDPGDAAGLTSVATTSDTKTPAPSTPISVAATYNSNGTTNAIIFPLLGFLADGPGLLFSGSPELAGGSVVSIVLDPSQVTAKDGTTPFAGSGILDGSLTFSVAAFSGAVSAQPTPPALPADAGVCATPPTTVAPDGTPVVVTFNNLIDPTAIAGHVTVTSTPVGGSTASPVAVDVSSQDGMNVNIAPANMGTWPPSSVINVAVDADAPDLVGDTVGAPGIATTFTTAAM